jgi:hypothetical protein
VMTVKTKSIAALMALVGSLAASGIALADTGPITVQVTGSNCSDINAALKSLPPTGAARVMLQAGTYLCQEPIVIDRSNTALVGQGRDKTLIMAPEMASFPVIVIGDMRVPGQPTLLELSGLSFDQLDALEGQPRGTYSKNAEYDIAFKWQFYPLTVIDSVQLSGLTINGGYYHRLTDGTMRLPTPDDLKALSAQVDLSGASSAALSKECYDTMSRELSDCANDGGRKIRNNALTIRRSTNVLVTDVRVEHAFSGGVVLEKGCENITIDGFQSTQNAFDGFAGYQTDKSTFKNMMINDNTLSGISIDMDFDNNIVSDSHLINNGDNGIFAHHTMGNKYINLEARHNGYLYLTNPNKSPGHGAWIDGKRRPIYNAKGEIASWQIILHTCDGNEFHNSSFIDNAGTPLTFNHPCQDIVLENVAIKTKDGNLADCKHNWPSAGVSYLGSFTCN